MFSLRDLCFVFCSRDLDVLRAQRIIGFFILITHKSTGSENRITLDRSNKARGVFLASSYQSSTLSSVSVPRFFGATEYVAVNPLS